MPLNLTKYKQLKSALWPIKGTVRSSHLDQGLAYGLGFPDYHALSCALETKHASMPIGKQGFDVTAFLERMGKLGYRPGQDVRDPHASLFVLAKTALSILEPRNFFEIINETNLTGSVARLDVTDREWKERVAAYRASLTYHWGPGSTGYAATPGSMPHVLWKITPPLRWKGVERLEISNSMIKVIQGADFGHILDERDAAKIQAVVSETGESPAAFFGRILTELRPYFPGFQDNEIDPLDEIVFAENGLMVNCRIEGRGFKNDRSCSVFFEKVPFQTLS